MRAGVGVPGSHDSITCYNPPDLGPAVIKSDQLTYRAVQFIRALRARPDLVETEQLRPYLSAAQITLFRQMQASEQAHACAVLHQLLENGQDHPDLMAAALLHDVGKSIYPLRLWERVLIVVVTKIWPDLAKHLGRSAPRLCTRPFIVAEQHAGWGAALASRVGVSPLGSAIIRRHQEPIDTSPESLEDSLLLSLQTADNNN